MAELVKKILTDKKARSSKKLKINSEVLSPWTVA